MERKLVLVEVDPVLVGDVRAVDADVDVEDPLVPKRPAGFAHARRDGRGERGELGERQREDHAVERDPLAVPEGDGPRGDVDPLDLAPELDAVDALSERARKRLDPTLPRVPEVRRRADLPDVVGESTGDDPLDVGSRNAPADPVELHLARLDRPDLPRVRDHQVVGDPVAERRRASTPRSSAARSSPRACRSTARTRPAEAVDDDLGRQAVEVRLERESRVEVVCAVVDERLARLRAEVRPEEIADEAPDLGIGGEQDVRAEVEDVPVDLDRASVAADASSRSYVCQSLSPSSCSV